MHKFICILSVSFFLYACGQESQPGHSEINHQKNDEAQKDISFEFNDFLSKNKELNKTVEVVFDKLATSQRVAQLIMPAIGEYGQKEKVIDELVNEKRIGGLLLLNGTKSQFKDWVDKYDALNENLNNPPFLYSADAEPSLINRKIKNTSAIPKANTLTSKKEVEAVAQKISDELKMIGVNYNFAPVVDVAPNKTVGWRGFGHEPDSLIPWSSRFIEVTQSNKIIATAKHFPGHGNVVGDTHEKLVYIDGDMTELENYVPLISEGVYSIMIAHIAIKNNPFYETQGMPATTSKKIVSDLLRDSLSFDGLIVTDAMNMGGVKKVENADVLAVKAGCDIVLMPLDARVTHEKLLELYETNDEMARRIDEAAKRIVRMKICLGWDPLK